MRSLPPPTPEGAEERSSKAADTQPELTLGVQLHAQEKTLRLIIEVYGPESVLPDVLAMHTIEMIPKSMILFNTGLSRLDIRIPLLQNTGVGSVLKITNVTFTYISNMFKYFIIYHYLT